jgi:hypothetical protein
VPGILPLPIFSEAPKVGMEYFWTDGKSGLRVSERRSTFPEVVLRRDAARGYRTGARAFRPRPRVLFPLGRFPSSGAATERFPFSRKSHGLFGVTSIPDGVLNDQEPLFFSEGPPRRFGKA